MSRGTLLFFLFAATTAVAQPASDSMVTTADVDAVAALRVLFGHQSVGANLLEGLAEVGAGKVPVHELGQPVTDTPGVLHFLAGTNEDPGSKLVAFEQALDRVGGKVDVAMLKLCYVDFNADTDVEALFTSYRDTLARVQAKYPTVRIVAVTAPLTIVQGGLKSWLKHLAGKPAWGERENPNRHAFNEKLRAEFPKPRLFDLAAAESKPGTASLREDFTDDGGHLNAAGRRAVTTAWVKFLAAKQ